MKGYLDLLRDTVHGVEKTDRTGTGTYSVFGRQFRHDLSKGFPLLTTKKIHWKSVVAELLWMIAGDTKVSTLKNQGVHIWDEWEKKDGTIGPGYGKQWRDWDAYDDGIGGYSIDQLWGLIQSLKDNPDSRRHIVSAWNVGEVDNMALPPCHCFFQCYVTPEQHVDATPGYHGSFARKPKLSLHMYQRSADVFLGVPFNIASYALLMHLLAWECGYDVGDLIISYGDLHLYKNHRKQAIEQLSRDPRELPKVHVGVVDEGGTAPTSIFGIRPCHILLEGYNPDSVIKAEVSV